MSYPTQGSHDAFVEFMALYSTKWGSHPASAASRRNDPVARRERELWAETIAKIRPQDFNRVLDAVDYRMRDMGVKGRPKLEDIVRAHRDITPLQPQGGREPGGPVYEMSLRDYLRQYAHKHKESPTFAMLWRKTFGTAPPGETQQSASGASRIDSAIVRALTYEDEERIAIDEEAL